ncbi:glycerol-3-phosphate dehydrogenase/oxidase [Leucobacter luti]|uniref:glycerol-3-phosphate dehydrogenase/oxidase n=1 Tax=Leucobacter luti TaxID=340320 RepID=UPI003D060F2B
MVVGGGINGIAILRDLALQGIDVALVERGDFVSGASSASSHMIHGGIRYLENGEFRLVQESVAERNELLRTAPHYVRPLQTTIPIHRTISGVLSAPFRLLVTHGRGKPRERGALLIKVGLMIYDTFSRDGGSVPRHRFRGRKASLAQQPALNPEFRYTATYFDASMHDPERLALDVLFDGLRAGGDRARAASYTAAVGLSKGGVRLRDETTGEEFDFSAPVVINATGSWADLTNDALGDATRFMGGTKGSHIVVDSPELLEATRGREMFFEHSDGRIVLIYPLKDRVLIGTTDIKADPRERTVCTEEEVDYFIELAAQVFPSIPVRRDQIVYTFSGIRPLPNQDQLAPGFVSRDYRIEEAKRDGSTVLTVVGGKWTTFRALAEHVTDRALAALGSARKVSTSGRPIGGGAGFPRTERDRGNWILTRAGEHPAALVETMLERYGTRAEEVLEVIPAGASPLVHAPGYFQAELAHLAAEEQVVHLDDVLMRRTSLAFVGGLTTTALREVAEAVADSLGWDPDTVDAEVRRAAAILLEHHLIDVTAKEAAQFVTERV